MTVKTTTEATRYESYKYARNTLSRRQNEVLQSLRNMGRASNREISEYMDREINTITGRVLELRQKGLVKPGGTKRETTGRLAIVWVPCLPENLF